MEIKDLSFEIEDEVEFHPRWGRIILVVVVLVTGAWILISGDWRAHKFDTQTAWQHGYEDTMMYNRFQARGIFIYLEGSCAADARWSVQNALSGTSDPWADNLKRPGAEAEYVQGCIAARRHMTHDLHDRFDWRGENGSADEAVAQAELRQMGG